MTNKKDRYTNVREHKRKGYVKEDGTKVSPAKVKKHKRKIPTKPNISKEVKEKIEDGMAKELKEKGDWAHLSDDYPNLLGLTDREINRFIETHSAPYGEYRGLATDTSLGIDRVEALSTNYVNDLMQKDLQDLSDSDIKRAIKEIDFHLYDFTKEKIDEHTDMFVETKEVQRILNRYKENLTYLGATLEDLKEALTLYRKEGEKEDRRRSNTLIDQMQTLLTEIKTDYQKLPKKVEYESPFKDYRDRGKKTLSRQGLKNYLRNIKCFNRQDIYNLSKKAFKEWKQKARKQSTEENPLNMKNTVFLTSPRGGYEVLGAFAYANDLDKTNLPTDLHYYLESSKGRNLIKNLEQAKSKEGDITIGGESLPYGNQLTDANDIVIVDDVINSGEQSLTSSKWLKKKLKDVSPEEQPRIHFITIAGRNRNVRSEKKNWDTVTAGKRYIFPEDKDLKEDFGFAIRDYKQFAKDSEKDFATAVVFPHAIPDGKKHKIARDLYKYKQKDLHTR